MAKKVTVIKFTNSRVQLPRYSHNAKFVLYLNLILLIFHTGILQYFPSIILELGYVL